MIENWLRRCCDHTANGCTQMGVSGLLWIIHHRKPCLMVISARHDGYRIQVWLIDQKDHHLTIAMIANTLWAWAHYLCLPGIFEVKSTDYPQLYLLKLRYEPVHGLLTWNVYYQEGGFIIHQSRNPYGYESLRPVP